MRSARAEEGVIRLLLLDPALFPRAQALEAEKFSSPFLGKVYRLLCERWRAGETPRIPMLTGELSRDEMNRLVQAARPAGDRTKYGKSPAGLHRDHRSRMGQAAL